MVKIVKIKQQYDLKFILLILQHVLMINGKTF
ncbi:hypothetical protein SAMN05421738_11847 [Algoriella xinjiangensis]|uniref:Uncharacterized protein n=1 Tax=Algoriella xinjiangensis TaxID=684065 RepID=A0A1I5AT32_9FLAO|nr:hypothetical protein SAMN05421738_11847 [Algoriella xinjiangensis]VDH16997.1 Uncharacterised protein [Algoriella xinjiangensis]